MNFDFSPIGDANDHFPVLRRATRPVVGPQACSALASGLGSWHQLRNELKCIQTNSRHRQPCGVNSLPCSVQGGRSPRHSPDVSSRRVLMGKWMPDLFRFGRLWVSLFPSSLDRFSVLHVFHDCAVACSRHACPKRTFSQKPLAASVSTPSGGPGGRGAPPTPDFPSSPLGPLLLPLGGTFWTCPVLGPEDCRQDNIRT